MSLSLLAEYDEICRLSNYLMDEFCEPECLQFVLLAEDQRVKLVTVRDECERLMRELQTANAARSDLERKLHTARQMLDLERKKSRKSESKVQLLENKMGMVYDLVWDGRNKLHDETRERLATVCSKASPAPSLGYKAYELRESQGHGNKFHEADGLSTISEALDSTGSILSELGYTRSEDELDVSSCHGKKWRKHRPSDFGDRPPSAKKPRSSATTLHSEKHTEVNGFGNECLVATTTVTVSRDGPVQAKSTIETIPPQAELKSKTLVQTPVPPPQVVSVPPAPISTSESEESMICFKENICKTNVPTPSPYHSGINLGRDMLNNRSHTFCKKTSIKIETCEPCGKRIKFGKLALKCKDCFATIHLDCRDKLPLPCVPATSTPTHKGQLGGIADFAPSIPPMIPGLILHCVKEIEARGLKEVGIYRVPGSERDVKALKERFLRGRGAPNISEVDVHVLCSLVKDFLRSLREPLVTPSLWQDFVRCVECTEEADQQARLYQVVSELPRPNRDTLAFLVLHLQRISECSECKMPVANIAKIFGPTVIGYSNPNLDLEQVHSETTKIVPVMALLMKIPSSYWACHINSNEICTPEVTSHWNRTPSASSVHASGGFFNTPLGTIGSHQKRKFFAHLG